VPVVDSWRLFHLFCSTFLFLGQWLLQRCLLLAATEIPYLAQILLGSLTFHLRIPAGRITKLGAGALSNKLHNHPTLDLHNVFGPVRTLSGQGIGLLKN
jgi:hypothetical protein